MVSSRSAKKEAAADNSDMDRTVQEAKVLEEYNALCQELNMVRKLMSVPTYPHAAVLLLFCGRTVTLPMLLGIHTKPLDRITPWRYVAFQYIYWRQLSKYKVTSNIISGQSNALAVLRIVCGLSQLDAAHRGQAGNH
jgi:hypothetical protein